MALTLTETEWVRAHEGTTVTFQAHQCQYKLATNYYKTLTFYIKRCVGVQFTHAPCVCSNDVSITYMYMCVWEMRGHPLICLRTLLVFVHKQHMFILLLISDSFISWPFYLFLCQYSTNIPRGAYEVLFCLGYGCKVKKLDTWNAAALFWCYKKCCSWYFTLFAVGRLQSPVLWAISCWVISLSLRA